MTCPKCGADRETDKLSRKAAHAEGAHEAATAIRLAVMLVVGNLEATGETVPLSTLRQVLEQTLDTHLDEYIRNQQTAIGRFVAEVQRKALLREYPGRAPR